jgi:hypothetical protein
MAFISLLAALVPVKFVVMGNLGVVLIHACSSARHHLDGYVCLKRQFEKWHNLVEYKDCGGN